MGRFFRRDLGWLGLIGLPGRRHRFSPGRKSAEPGFLFL
jgi:hypothetical protein